MGNLKILLASSSLTTIRFECKCLYLSLFLHGPKVILGALLLVCLTNAATTVEKSSKEDTEVELLKIVEDTDVSEVSDEVSDVAEERKDVVEEEVEKALEEG